MSRVGQCPSCHAIYELDDDAIGRVMDCQCGLALFVCDVAGFSEIPVCCTECRGQYVVDRDGAGEVVECECGEHLTVPSVVLRPPVNSPNVNPHVLDSGQDPTPEEAVVACPGCGKQYSVAEEDFSDEAECRCGCLFRIKAKSDGTVFAQEIQATQESQETKNEEDLAQLCKYIRVKGINSEIQHSNQNI